MPCCGFERAQAGTGAWCEAEFRRQHRHVLEMSPRRRGERIVHHRAGRAKLHGLNMGELPQAAWRGHRWRGCPRCQ